MAFRARGRVAALALLGASGCAQGVGLSAEGTPTDATGTTADPTTTDPPTTESPTGPGTTTEVDGTSSTGAPTTDTGDESSTGDESTTGEPEGPHPELYPFDRTHSPITAYVAERMRAIATPGPMDAVFAKIGGSATASSRFLACLAVPQMIQQLPADEPNLQATIDYFNVQVDDAATSFSRVSLAAMAGWSSAELVAGAPTPIGAELTAIGPRFALVLTGTEDLAKAQPAALFTFAEHLLTAVEELTTAGVVPILSTLPQRTDLPETLPYIPRYNAVIRAVAQGRQVPLVDLGFALAGTPNFGLADGVDLSVFVSADLDRPCHFSEAALQFGYNVRNLESLRALDRARRVVIDQEPELDPPAPGLAGSGTFAEPYEIPSLPFVDLRSTVGSPSDGVDAYGGACDPDKDESGPEVVYRLSVDADVDVRFMVFDRDPVDVDIHVLDTEDPATCLKRNDRELSGPLPPGEYYVVVDSYAGQVMGGAAGEYALAVLPE
jgi:hypothetical protein